MFLDSDKKDMKDKKNGIQNLRFLTNQRNMRPEALTSEFFADEQMDFGRLISPSIVVEISLKQLEAL